MDSIDKAFIRALFTADYYRGYAAIEHYVAKVVSRLFVGTKVGAYLRESFRSVDEIMGNSGYHAQSRPLLAWALRYLEQEGLAESKASSYRMKTGTPDTDTGGDIKRILAASPSADIFIRLVERIGPEIQDFLYGRKNGADILLAGEAASLWNDYFNNRFYGYSVLNYGAAYGITKWFSRTGGRSMLELGSGTSGATVRAFQMLRDNNLLDSIAEITLTDISDPLLGVGKRNIDSSISPPPRYEQKILDINLPFGGQGFKDGFYDIVFGVNVLHVARDLAFSLNEVRRCIRKGGVLVIAETIRPARNKALSHELIFNLLDGYYGANTHPETRPCHGFLTKELWTRNLEAAGFGDMECITELDQDDRLDFDIRPLHSFMVLKGEV